MLKTVSEEVKQQRMTICLSCDDFRPAVKTCKKCGCFMPAKATFALSSCPAGKWGKSQPGNSLINKIEEQILESWNKQ